MRETLKNQHFWLLRLVQLTGLEPVRDYHTPLKRARLPIPPLSRQPYELYQNELQMSTLFSKFFYFLFTRFLLSSKSGEVARLLLSRSFDSS